MCKSEVSHGQTDYRMLSAASLTDKVRIENIIRTTYLQGAMFNSSKCALLKIPIWRQNLGCGTLYSLFWLLPDLHAKVVKLSDFRNVQFICTCSHFDPMLENHALFLSATSDMVASLRGNRIGISDCYDVRVLCCHLDEPFQIISLRRPCQVNYPIVKKD